MHNIEMHTFTYNPQTPRHVSIFFTSSSGSLTCKKHTHIKTQADCQTD